MPSGTHQHRHQLTDEGQQDLHVLPDPDRKVANLFNERERLALFSGRPLYWDVSIEIKEAAELLFEPPNRYLPADRGLVLLKFDEEGDTSPVAVVHSRGIDDDLDRFGLLEDVQGLSPQPAGRIRIYVSSDEECQGRSIGREPSLKRAGWMNSSDRGHDSRPYL
jgi:hypothetical protein